MPSTVPMFTTTKIWKEEKRTRRSFLSKRELEKRGRVTSFTQNFKPVARPKPFPLAFSQNPTKTLHVTT
jgi:hypothetical protein